VVIGRSLTAWRYSAVGLLPYSSRHSTFRTILTSASRLTRVLPGAALGCGRIGGQSVDYTIWVNRLAP
jgi:hypothetical protein